MTNTGLLEEIIKASGYKKGFIAAQAGMSRAQFCDCVKNRRDFKTSQIHAICELLQLDAEQLHAIFFAVNGA